MVPILSSLPIFIKISSFGHIPRPSLAAGASRGATRQLWTPDMPAPQAAATLEGDYGILCHETFTRNIPMPGIAIVWIYWLAVAA